jgi:acetylornithine deacetylase
MTRALNAVEERILEAVRRREQDTVDLLAQLVAIPSLTGEEGRAQDFVADRLRELGCGVDTWEPDVRSLFERYPQVAQYPSHWQHDLILPYESLPTWDDLVRSGAGDVLNYRGRPNVVGRLPASRQGGRSLILNGHVDVVTVEPRAQWTHDPFGATILNGRLYGRGTADMKAGLVAGLAAMQALRDARVSLAADLLFESVVNEEHSGNGTLACVARGLVADAAIVLEPTDGAVGLGTSGAVYWGVVIHGRQVGTSARWGPDGQVGVSAIEKLPAVVTALLDLEAQFNLDARDPAASGRRPFSLAMGTIRGGTYDTATAAECVIKGSAYFSPNCGSVTSVMEAIKGAVRQCAAADPWLRSAAPVVQFYHHDDAATVAVESPIAATLIKAAAAVTGTPPAIRPRGGACDMRHLVNQGRMPAVIFGPGSGQQAHRPDEYVELSALVPCIQTLALTIYRWCGA